MSFFPLFTVPEYSQSDMRMARRIEVSTGAAAALLVTCLLLAVGYFSLQLAGALAMLAGAGILVLAALGYFIALVVVPDEASSAYLRKRKPLKR